MKVVNKSKGEYYTVYIGRGSIFGNPYIIGRDGTREDVVAKYEIYARNLPIIMKAIGQLKENDILGCFCKPLACHGDVIIKLWKEIHYNAKTDN